MAEGFRRAFWGLVLVAVMLGVWLRGTHLDRKVVWHDEAYTALRASGFNGRDVVARLFDGRVRSPADLLYFQRPQPERGLGDVWRVLAEHPEHPPLYYLLGRWAMQATGTTIPALRGVAAAASLLALPALYWLAWECCPAARLGGLAIALFSLSPFHLLYAQEARQYSLWTLATLLTTAALLRALRLPSRRTWAVYGLTLALSLYSSLLTALVVLGQLLYGLAVSGWRLPDLWRAWAIASGLALLSFAPWLGVLGQHYPAMTAQTSWMQSPLPWPDLFAKWGLHITALVLDLPLPPRFYALYNVTVLPGAVLGAALLLLWFWRRGPRPARGLILLLVLLPALGLILPDLLLGGQRSSISRYFIPSYLGLQVAGAYWFYVQGQRPQARFWALVLVLVLSLGLGSGLASWGAPTWWNKLGGSATVAIAATLHQAERPLVVSTNTETNLGHLLALAQELSVRAASRRNDRLRLQLTPAAALPVIAPGFEPIFLFNPPPAWLEQWPTAQPLSSDWPRLYQVSLD